MRTARFSSQLISFFRGACLAAGSLFFLLSLPLRAEEPLPVKFAAWNLRNYLHTVEVPEKRAPRDTRPKPAAEIEAVTRILLSVRPDIAGFCEVGSPVDLAALQQRLKEAGLDLPHSEYVQAADQDRHLALLSRFPIVARQPQTSLSYLLDDSKLPLQRGILDVTLQITPEWQLRCAGVHLKSRRDVPEADEALMRRNEAHLVRQYVDGILTASPETNLLIYGDFNSSRNEPSYRAVTGTRGSEAYLTALTPVDADGERWTYYYPDADAYSRIDYLFASRGLMPQVVPRSPAIYSGGDWLDASDHRLISVEILPQERTRRR